MVDEGTGSRGLSEKRVRVGRAESSEGVWSMDMAQDNRELGMALAGVVGIEEARVVDWDGAWREMPQAPAPRPELSSEEEEDDDDEDVFGDDEDGDEDADFEEEDEDFLEDDEDEFDDSEGVDDDEEEGESDDDEDF